jgi:hypothetical protein
MALNWREPVTVAERSKPFTPFARSEAGIVGSSPTQGMDVWCVFMRLFCVCVVLCLSRGLTMSWSPVQGNDKWNWEISPMLQSGARRKECVYNNDPYIQVCLITNSGEIREVLRLIVSIQKLSDFQHEIEPVALSLCECEFLSHSCPLRNTCQCMTSFSAQDVKAQDRSSCFQDSVFHIWWSWWWW